MQVLCIDKLIHAVPTEAERPVFMQQYTVDDEGEYLHFGLYYHLQEFPGDQWWNADKFIPISNIDEKDIRRNKAVDKFLSSFISK